MQSYTRNTNNYYIKIRTDNQCKENIIIYELLFVRIDDLGGWKRELPAGQFDEQEQSATANGSSATRDFRVDDGWTAE